MSVPPANKTRAQACALDDALLPVAGWQVAPVWGVLASREAALRVLLEVPLPLPIASFDEARRVQTDLRTSSLPALLGGLPPASARVCHGIWPR